MLLNILFFSFILIVVIQLFYYGFLFGIFAYAKPIAIAETSIPISIVIAAKNEAENLQNNLHLILNQNYPNFEVIVINDASTDSSSKILQHLSEEYEQLKILSIDATNTYSGNKKKALSLGIQASKYDVLLFTDADCKPVSNNWILSMASHFSDTTDIVLGYGAYQKINGSFLNKLIRYETLLTAVQYFSYAKSGIPYMGVGRNLAYKKELFLNNGGFENHSQLKSGDDDLFINQVATSNNTKLCFHKESFTISSPKITFKNWFQQKRRHISTATYYTYKHQLLLGLFFVSQFLFWFLAIILLISSFNLLIVTSLVAVRLIVQFVSIYYSSKKLNEIDLIRVTPLLDFLVVCLQLGLFISNIIFKPKHW